MIRLEKIDKAIGSKMIFNQFSLELEAGELVAIVGKSGSGKTTLLNILGLIDDDYKGLYTFEEEQNIKANSSKAQKIIREKISYLFQNFALIENETVEANLMMALKYVKTSKKEKLERIRQVLVRVGLEETQKQKVSELSGGEQQRIAIARAFLKPSQLLLADEPTGSLDTENREIILRFLLEINRSGKTVVIVTHDPYIAERCSKVIELS